MCDIIKVELIPDLRRKPFKKRIATHSYFSSAKDRTVVTRITGFV